MAYAAFILQNVTGSKQKWWEPSDRDAATAASPATPAAAAAATSLVPPHISAAASVQSAQGLIPFYTRISATYT